MIKKNKTPGCTLVSDKCLKIWDAWLISGCGIGQEVLQLSAFIYEIVTPCFDSLPIRQSPLPKDTSSQHWYAPGFKG